MTPAQLRLAAERLCALADGKRLQARGLDGQWRDQHNPICSARCLASDRCRIAPDEPALPPKPSQEWLDKHGVELTGECRKPATGDYGWYSHMFGVASAALTIRTGAASVERHMISTDPHGYLRWILRRRDPQVRPWELSPLHARKVVIRNDGAGWGLICGVRDGQFVIAGWGKVTPAELARDWKLDVTGSPCGEVLR